MTLWNNGLHAISNDMLIGVGGSLLLLLTVLVIYLTCCEEQAGIQPYRFRHDPPGPVPGSSASFAETSTMESTATHTILRTYHTPPQHRPGNGMSDVTRPRAVLVWSASVGQHCNRYAHVATTMAPLGYAVCGLDHAGTGESAGLRGCMTHYQDQVSDLIQYSKDVQTMYPGIPLFVGGAAAGASLAICATLQAPQLFHGMILLAPLIHTNLHPYFRSLLPFVARIFPSLPLIHAIPHDMHSRNPNVAKHISTDPLIPKTRLTASTANEILRVMEHVNSTLNHVTIPYLVQHGLKDMVCCPTGTRTLVTETIRVRPCDRTLVALPRCWHDLLHEAEHHEVISHMVDWMEEHIRIQHLAETLD